MHSERLLPFAVFLVACAAQGPAAPSSPAPVVATPPAPVASTPAPTPQPAVSASQPTPADTPPSASVAEAAIARARDQVEQTPVVKKLTALGSFHIEVKGTPACDRPNCDVRVEVILDADPYYAFVVRPDGTLLVQEVGGSLVPYDSWATAEVKALSELEATIHRLMDKIAKLPDIVSYGKRSASQGGALAIWPEGLPLRGCSASGPNCNFSFYVGESFSTHATRWSTFYVARHGEAISVYSIDQERPLPYATWRTRKVPRP